MVLDAEVDMAVLPPQVPVVVFPSALDWDLVRSTHLLLQQVGILPSTTTAVPSAVLYDATYTHVVAHPLIPHNDIVLLLSILPVNLLPASLPFTLPAMSPSTPSHLRQRVLDTLARLSLEPSLTLPILSQFRPLAAHLFGRWLEMLHIDSATGEFPEQNGPSDAALAGIDKVMRAMTRILSVFENVYPFLAVLLRHPLLVAPLIPAASSTAQELAGPLLSLYTLLHCLPHLSTSALTAAPATESNPRPAPWSFPPVVEEILKTHPHRGTRLLAWRILRSWYHLYANVGENLREQWVWKGVAREGEAQGEAPLPAYPLHYQAEYTSEFGPWTGEAESADILPGWSSELIGEARFIPGGVEVQVRERSVDVWLLPMMEDLRANEERVSLQIPRGIPEEEHVSELPIPVGLGHLEPSELSCMVAHVEGYLVFREGLLPSLSGSTTSTLATVVPTSPAPEPFVNTPATTALLRTLSLHLQRRMPVLISSPPSAGKASTVRHLWNTLHSLPLLSGGSAPTTAARKRGLVVINLADRSLDSKSLLGSLSSAPSTSDSEAGTFIFIEGPLTRAVRQGRWVVLTAIDQASIEVLSVIKVLAERMKRGSEAGVGASWGGGAGEENGGVGVRVGGGSGKWVRAGQGFMLFATRSIDSTTSSQPADANFFASHFFSHVWLPAPRLEEISTIVEGRYERLQKNGLGRRLIGVWEDARAVVVREGGAGTGRPIGVRDLLRWCRRVQGLLPRDVEIRSIEANPVLQEEIYTEARDVFLGSLPLPPLTSVSLSLFEARDRYSVIAKVMAEGLSLSEERAEHVLRRRDPDCTVPRIDEQDGRVSTAEYFLKIGRVSLPFRKSRVTSASRPYALTKPSRIVLEKLAVCLRLSEPVLMVGETGTGKTAAVGHLAELMGKNLTALNLSNQTEAGDLIGGFRPIDEAAEAKRTAAELFNRSLELMSKTQSPVSYTNYKKQAEAAFKTTSEKRNWRKLVTHWREASRVAVDKLSPPEPSPVLVSSTSAAAGEVVEGPRKRRKVDPSLLSAWLEFITQVGEFEVRYVLKAGKSKFVFSFVEGPLAKAIRSGDWVLLDEVNLASAETLESLSTLLQSPDSSLILTEQGDLEPIPRHPEFRLFACMNPATDVGKRDLPAALRAKFSEIWVPPPDADREALVAIITGYVGRSAAGDLGVIANVADLYTSIKGLAISAQLADGSNQPPHYSMRTLARALTFASDFTSTFGIRRALYEGFLMSFTMLLEPKSSTMVKALIEQHIVKGRLAAFTRDPQPPSGIDPSRLIKFGSYWLETGPEELQEPSDYILTPSVQSKVLDLARAVLTKKVPVLIQGPTSSGKTSVVEYLAKRTGHRFVRINNHEHTDIQEYIGTYVSDTNSGKLVFQEGVLVRALRRGDWIVLDELNLAPTDVLEALNRLLDDNRELVIPETGEVVTPHPHFMLFATQNPPGLYGGRKVLSRAFRNRFLEMHFGDVPQDELETILCQRCQIAPSYAKKTVAVFLELQRRRQSGRVFEQKQAFATLRDLFRWGGRGSVGYQQLAEDGYMLLAERARKPEDKAVVKQVIEQEMKVLVDDATLYDFSKLEVAGLPAPPTTSGLVWTSAMRRLYFLIAAGLHRNEPVLLVGETGSGKTSVCQSLALALGLQLHIIGCHQNTETADLLGGQRPLRNRSALQSALRHETLDLLHSVDQPRPADSDDFDELIYIIDTLIKSLTPAEAPPFVTLVERMRKTTALFEWHDGPLVQAMHAGDLILLDEISLADDSVLERLNSVLEPSRTLVLAEKGGRDLDDIKVVGAPGFQILATMNPGGDFGKKELSPALRNRFTEIWVPLVDDREDLLQIISSRWQDPALAPFGPLMLDFGQWFGAAVGMSKGLGIGLRDILAWVDFLNIAALRLSSTAAEETSRPSLLIADAFCQGALMTVVDGMGALPTTSGLSKDALQRLRQSCWRHLESLSHPSIAPEAISLSASESAEGFYIGPFGVAKGPLPPSVAEFTLHAPTTRLNAMRLLRALQLTKPVLLEGSPGVGKTSLVTAIAAATGHNLVRINLSDQTDLMDLLGSDLPVEGGQSGEFAWKDAPFLAAMQEGAWVLLDEMNLASQSILEGLNSCLDHRGTVYIPELDRTFTRHPDFRIFAAQNPLGQGGGRKGLPKSFLDRFSIVHMEELNNIDLNSIASALYPDIDPFVLAQMINFNSAINRQSMESRAFGMEGAPWEFNLRDVLRWLALLRSSSELDLRSGEAAEYAGLLYLQRFRTVADRSHVAKLFLDAFAQVIDPVEQPYTSLSSRFAQIGHSLVTRSDVLISNRQTTTPSLLQRSLQPLEALTKCFAMGWLAILTGPRDSGKTTLVRQLAALEGRPLREFSMNAEVDTLELLGSFEQAEKFREIERVAADAVVLLEDCIRHQFGSSSTVDYHAALSTLVQLRLGLGTFTSDIVQAADIIISALQLVLGGEHDIPVQLIFERLAAATATTHMSARFEWIDGPLVQAMKNGEWLLIEDANLCSPSVLDRLNSLFEPGGRLQLAERGPVDGEIQVIYPHPDFRLVMTLDPRNGELSRAMRNRGIEIALLDATKTSAEDIGCLSRAARVLAPATADHLILASSLLHASLAAPTAVVVPVAALLVAPVTSPSTAPLVLAATLNPLATETDPTILAQHLLATIATSHYGLTIRFLRAVRLLDLSTTESAIRNLSCHSLVALIDDTKLRATTTPDNARFQASDLALAPHLVGSKSAHPDQRLARLALSPALDALTSLFLSVIASPESLQLISSKPARSLNVWEKSLLAAHGRLREDDVNLAMISLYPAMVALGVLISRLLSEDLLSMETGDRNAAILSANVIRSLVTELEVVSRSGELDFSSVQHIASWISNALQQVPALSSDLAAEARLCLVPLANSLVLTTGKAMSSIWRACLPYRPASLVIADAYERLLQRGIDSTGELWAAAIVDLFLDIAVTLGTPQFEEASVHDSSALELVEQVLQRLPVKPILSVLDPALCLTNASNAASLASVELAAVANVFVTGNKGVWAQTLVQVARGSGIVPIATVVPIHQLVSWNSADDQVDRLKSSVEFKTLLGWSERLTLSVPQEDLSDAEVRPSAADLVRPTLLRASVALRATDTSTLGNLITLSESLWRSARLQALTAASDSTSRVGSLKSALLASIALAVNGCTTESDVPVSPDSQSLCHHLLDEDSARPPALAEGLELYLRPALVALVDESSPTTTLAAVGEGYIALSRMLWHLYVPNLALDPAVGLRAHSNYLQRQFDALSQLYAAFVQSEARLTGNSSNLKLESISIELEILRQGIDTAGVLPVHRAADVGLLAGLFRELRSFREQIMSDLQVDDLLQQLRYPWSPEVANRESNLQYSIENILRRLSAAYGALDDILGPVRLSLCLLKIGLSLLLHSSRSSTLDSATSPFAVLLLNLTSFPTIAHTLAIQSADLPLSIKVGEAPLAASRATLLQTASLVSQLSTHAVFDRSALKRLTQLYDRMHYLWSADRKHEEEALQEAQSLYKIKTDIQQVATDEEIEAAEFAQLFPSYEETADDLTAKPVSTTQAPTTSVPRLLLPSDQATLAKLHVHLFVGDAASSTASAVDFETLRGLSIGALLPGLFESMEEGIDRASAAYRIKALVEISQSASPTQGVHAYQRDFYNEPDVRETAKAVPILQAMSIRLASLVETWPEQMVLHNLKERCDAILLLSSKSSVAQVLTAVEALLVHTEDWETYASREHSIILNRTALTGLIVDWRRLELTCWSRLLSTVQDHFGDPVSEWWFRFYETTIRGAPGVDAAGDEAPIQSPTEYYRDLVALLDSFLATSSLGQFETRLQLVLSFSRLAAKLGEDSTAFEAMAGAESLRIVSRLMMNIHGFYQQFSPRVKSFVTAERARIDKDVQNLIKLASWKDVNVYALKQSAIRSHHQLYKSVRKLRMVLQKPASDYFTIAEFDRAHAPYVSPPISATVGSDAVLPAMPDALNSVLDSLHIVRLDQTLARLGSLVQAKIDPFISLDRATLVDDFAVHIITTAKSLKAESTPGAEEGREARVKNLSSRKRRAWIELLRELKRLGLSPTPTPDVVARVQDSSFVYALPASHDLVQLDPTLLPESLRVQLVKSDEYHFRLLSDMPALRSFPAEHHQDISTREVQRAIGSIESCISVSFDNRALVLATLAGQVELEATLLRLAKVAHSTTTQPLLTSRPLAESLLDIVSQVLAALAEARQAIAHHQLALQSTSVEVAAVDTALATAHDLLSDDQRYLVDVLRSMVTRDHILSLPAELVVFEATSDHLTHVKTSLVNAVCPPALAYLVQPLAAWIVTLEIPAIRCPPADATHPAPALLASLKVSHITLVDSILVIAQELVKLADLDKPLEVEGELSDLAIKFSAKTLQSTLGAFRLAELQHHIVSFSQHAHLALGSSLSISPVTTLLQRTLPFLIHYSSLLARHLSSFLECHKASLKLAYVLTSVVKELSQEGFCKPSEDDGEAGEDGKTTDGTGMADGTGATNVSKEIEDEDQIEGLQGDVPQQDKPEEQDGDDDAVEMREDFEGDMEDRGDGDKDDKEDESDAESDSDSKVDPEEQMADVDPLDPSSVDEKFWGDESSKEQDGANEEINQETTKSAGESEMAAKEDEAPAPQPKGDGAEDEADAEGKEEEAKERPAAEEGQELDGEGEDGEDGEDGEGKEEDGKEEEEEQDGDDDVAAQEDGQKLDERMPEGDNLDLPDDMQLDGDDKKDDDDLDLGSDMGDLEDDEANENPQDPDELGDANEEMAEDALPMEKFPEGEQPQVDADDAPELDQSSGGNEAGQTGGEGAQDTGTSTVPEPAPAADPTEQAGAQTEVEPVPAEAGGEDEAEKQDKETGTNDEADDTIAESDPSLTAPSNAADGQTKQRSSASDPKSDPSRSQQNKPSPAEPQRSLGDALQSWRRRLEAISDLSEPEPEKPDAEALAMGEEEGEVEFVQDGDEQDQDAQALGPASEEQVQGLEGLKLGEDDAQQTFEPDSMDVDDSTPSLLPPDSHVQLDSAPLAETDAKAVPATELRDDLEPATIDDDAADMDILRDADEELASSTLAAPLLDPEQDAHVEEQMLQWRTGDEDTLTADGVWRLYESLTRDLSYALTEQLRLILEPTLATRLKGDYASGKRLNMKKIIPYIASEFTKDKIWLRRTRPSQREYQILIAIDDSKSMADSHSIHLAYQTLALITRALARLEVGGIAIARFGDTTDVLHSFESGAINDEAGAGLLEKFSFAQRSTNVKLLVEKSLGVLAEAKESARSTKSSLAAGDLWQLQIILSDGVMQDQEKLRALLRKATEQKVMMVFVVIDSLHARATDTAPVADGQVNQNSILAMKSVSYTKGVDGKLELKMTRYLDSFPFENFVVLRDVEALPDVLSSLLRQFFEKVSSDR